MRTLFAVAVAALVAATATGQEPSFRSLFNGKNLDGWDTWLSRAHQSKEQIGLNKDPKGVYTVVTEDGKPVIRISGEIFGAITTKDEFENYHLRFEVKWGEKRWPPREKAVRDSGLLYHCVGPHGAGGGHWMKSFECQIQENDFGDFYSVAGVIVDVEGERKGDKGPILYRKGGQKFKGVTSRIIRNPLNEKPHGQWNVVELYAVGQTAVHVINGKTNMIMTGLRHKVDGKEVPLTKGKIQLQSEGAEVFYRNLEVRPIKEIPAEALK
jgi:hypothetical protein